MPFMPDRCQLLAQVLDFKCKIAKKYQPIARALYRVWQVEKRFTSLAYPLGSVYFSRSGWLEMLIGECYR